MCVYIYQDWKNVCDAFYRETDLLFVEGGVVPSFLKVLIIACCCQTSFYTYDGYIAGNFYFCYTVAQQVFVKSVRKAWKFFFTKW